ncbi:MAG TPA: hypothetical protein VHR84_01450 [Terriglobales bacterium]|jgi:hypothetical protein|nr:hypothetical protein [Terriglobales bacterium]
MIFHTIVHNFLRKLCVVVMVVAAVPAFSQTAPATKTESPAVTPEIQQLRSAFEKYKDPFVAVRDGYFSTVACINFPHESMPGHVQYPKGAMGVHFLNPALIAPVLDPMKPQILLYEPDANGALRLTGVEWFLPLALAKERPKMFGHEFLGPMEGHEPVMPSDLTHYDLHVWLFKDNPEGMFAPTNPAVKCTGYSYALDEHSTKIAATK